MTNADDFRQLVEGQIDGEEYLLRLRAREGASRTGYRHHACETGSTSLREAEWWTRLVFLALALGLLIGAGIVGITWAWFGT